MPNPADLRDIERRVHHAAFQDGLTEMALGIFLMLSGVFTVLRPPLVYFALLAALALAVGVERARRRLVYPRTGYVRFAPEKRGDMRGMLKVCGFLLVLLVASSVPFLASYGAGEGRRIWVAYFVPAYIGCWLAIGPVWLGRTYGLRRWIVIGVLFPALGILLPALGLATGYSAIGLLCLWAGAVVFLTGVVVFALFLHAHPEQEVADGA